MATEFPESYKDPLYASLDAQTERKLGLPVGLLSSIRTNGERSNHSATNDLKTFSSYQFIPATRKAILDKYGIDVTLSPENASEGAGLLLKESLDRNNGDATSAVGEYIGGTDRKNWGKTTNAYIARVMAGQQAQKTDALKNGFAEFMAANPAVPAGRSAATTPPAAAPAEKKADPLAEGFAQFMRRQESGPVSIPGAEAYDARPTPAPPTIGEQIVGAGETALSTGTGLAAGVVAPVVGAVGGAVKSFTNPTPGLTGQQEMNQLANQTVEALTYAPRTDAGQSQTAAVGNAMSGLPALVGHGPTLAGAGALTPAIKPTVEAIPPVVRNTANSAAQNVVQRIQAVREQGIPGFRPSEPAAPTPGTMASGGSAAVDMATQRRMAAQELPVPIKLTEGQATRRFEQQRFEGETAKNPEAGAPIRDRFAQQNQQVLQNFDAYLDQSGAMQPDLRSAGIAVDKALRDQLSRDKTEVRAKYKAAEKAGELESPVSTEGIVALLNESTSAEGTAKVLGAAKKELQRLGGATMDENGALVPGEMTLKSVEELRKFINANMDATGPDLTYGPRLKSAIDASTEGVGGQLYKEARAARQRVAQNFEDRASVSRILNNKPGTADRQVAFEDVFKHSILDGSLDDVRNMRRVLQRGGEDGQQAWKELQGQTVNYLREEATKNVARDQNGNPVVSAAALDKAVKKLDQDGKLDFIFGKRGAEQIRTINDVTNHIKTVAPGSVNTSNTASVLLAALDMGISGAGGMPLPIASGLRLVVNNVKDRRLRMRVAEALGDAERKAASRPKPIEGVTPKKRTLH